MKLGYHWVPKIKADFVWPSDLALRSRQRADRLSTPAHDVYWPMVREKRRRNRRKRKKKRQRSPKTIYQFPAPSRITGRAFAYRSAQADKLYMALEKQSSVVIRLSRPVPGLDLEFYGEITVKETPPCVQYEVLYPLSLDVCLGGDFYNGMAHKRLQEAKCLGHRHRFLNFFRRVRLRFNYLKEKLKPRLMTRFSQAQALRRNELMVRADPPPGIVESIPGKQMVATKEDLEDEEVTRIMRLLCPELFDSLKSTPIGRRR